jgi:hypothetical protein
MLSERVRPVFAIVLLTACGQRGAPREPIETTRDGLTRTATGWILRTSELDVEPGSERYFCYTAIVPDDMRIDRFASAKNTAIHHFQLNESFEGEEAGLSDCHRFPTGWSPLYTATTVSAELTTPAGSARFIAKGSRLVIQVHLLNSSNEALHTEMEIDMQESKTLDPEPVGILGFGSANIRLPPGQVTTVESTCRLDSDARLFEIVPHMHYLGRRLEFDLGPDEQSLEQVYVRDPFEFDNQYFERFERVIPAGTVARVRCIYDNDTDQTVAFGESSSDEMCNLAAFVVGHKGLKVCTHTPSTASVPKAPDAGVCGQTETPSGIGRMCSKGGTECGSELYCSADVLNMPFGICLRVGCNNGSDCEGATCCTPSGAAGVVNVCAPEACRPEDCIPVGAE